MSRDNGKGIGRHDTSDQITTKTKRGSVLQRPRKLIEIAKSECEHTHRGGHRHMNRWLSPWEIEHHDAVDRFLERNKK